MKAVTVEVSQGGPWELALAGEVSLGSAGRFWESRKWLGSHPSSCLAPSSGIHRKRRRAPPIRGGEVGPPGLVDSAPCYLQMEEDKAKRGHHFNTAQMLFSDFKDLVVQLRKQGYNRYENMIQKHCMAEPAKGLREPPHGSEEEGRQGEGLVRGRHCI